VADVLTDPFAVAAIVVVVAGLSKLRAPAVAARALRELGIPAGSALVRVLAAAEVAFGVWCLIAPGGAAAVVLACCYAAFCVISLLLARRRQSCGCFGDDEVPASVAHSLVSAVLALVCFAAAVRSPHAVGWVLGRPADEAAVLALGIAASAYATVLAYTRLPIVWAAWSPR
jgi:hypothetical protein